MPARTEGHRRFSDWQWFPYLAAAGVLVVAVVATAIYVNSLESRSLEFARTLAWVVAAPTGAILASAAFILAKRPAKERLLAQKIAEDLRSQGAQLQRLLHEAPVLMFRTDMEGRILMSEGAAAESIDAPDGGWLGKNIFDFGTAGQEWVRYIRRALAGEHVTALIRQGERDWEINYQPWNEPGDTPGMLGIATDVTERRREAQDDFQKLQETAEVERLRELNEMKTNLLNTAAHELNTPMTPVRLQLHLLKSESLGDLTTKQERAVAILDRAVDRLGLLVDDILDVAKVQSGRMKVEIKPVRLRRLLEEIVDTFQEPASQVGVRLSFEAGPDVWAHADPSRITQVLTNLASNAIKFTPSGGTITVRCTEVDGLIRTEFQDSGRGLSPEEIQLLFQPFSQVHDPREVTARGTGLGLYISKGILDRHEGEIGVESAGLGHGSTFYFVLPQAEPSDEAEEELPMITPRAEVKQAPLPARLKSEDGMAERLRELI